MNIKEAHFSDEPMSIFDGLRTRELPRRPSVEMLETVKLRPTFTSFPEPARGGHTPPLPDFIFPRFRATSASEYESLQHDEGLLDPAVEEIESKDTFVQSVFITANYYLGAGILALPGAVIKAPYISLIYLVVGAIMFRTSGQRLGNCQIKLLSRSYPHIAETAVGVGGRLLMSTLFYTHLLVDMTVYLMLFTKCLSKLTGFTEDVATYLAALIVIFESNIFTNMRKVCRLGAVSMIAMCFTACLILIGLGITTQATHGSILRDFQQLRPATKWRDIGRSAGIISYCYAGNSVLTNVFKTMRHPELFPALVHTNFAILATLYCLFAVLAISAYNEQEGASLKRILMDNLDTHAMLTYFTVGMLCLTSACRSALASFPITECICEIFALERVRGGVKSIGSCCRNILKSVKGSHSPERPERPSRKSIVRAVVRRNPFALNSRMLRKQRINPALIRHNSTGSTSSSEDELSVRAKLAASPGFEASARQLRRFPEDVAESSLHETSEREKAIEALESTIIDETKEASQSLAQPNVPTKGGFNTRTNSVTEPNDSLVRLGKKQSMKFRPREGDAVPQPTNEDDSEDNFQSIASWSPLHLIDNDEDNMSAGVEIRAKKKEALSTEYPQTPMTPLTPMADEWKPMFIQTSRRSAFSPAKRRLPLLQNMPIKPSYGSYNDMNVAGGGRRGGDRVSTRQQKMNSFGMLHLPKPNTGAASAAVTPTPLTPINIALSLDFGARSDKEARGGYFSLAEEEPGTGQETTPETRSEATRRCVHTVVRTVLPLIALALATLVNDITVLMALSGGIFGISIGYTGPIVFYAKIFHRSMTATHSTLCWAGAGVGLLITCFIALATCW